MGQNDLPGLVSLFYIHAAQPRIRKSGHCSGPRRWHQSLIHILAKHARHAWETSDGLAQVECLALREPLDDVVQDDVDVAGLSEALGHSAAGHTGADDRYFGAQGASF